MFKQLKAYARIILKKEIRIFWWRLEFPDRLNFGDEITPLIVESLFDLKPVWAQPDQCDLVGAGSIIEVVDELSFGHKVNVWGSGYIREDSKNAGSNLRFHAVRGSSTLKRVDKDSLPLGDPGLLISLVFTNPVEKQHKLGVVPHYVDADSDELKIFLKENPDAFVIDPLWDVEKVVESIKSCECIVSSSLHGLVVSDAYSIPNKHLAFSDQLTGGLYKFDDYYSALPDGSGNRISWDKKSENTEKWIVDNYVPIDPQELDRIQKSLIKAFPFKTL